MAEAERLWDQFLRILTVIPVKELPGVLDRPEMASVVKQDCRPREADARLVRPLPIWISGECTDGRKQTREPPCEPTASGRVGGPRDRRSHDGVQRLRGGGLGRAGNVMDLEVRSPVWLAAREAMGRPLTEMILPARYSGARE